MLLPWSIKNQPLMLFSLEVFPNSQLSSVTTRIFFFALFFKNLLEVFWLYVICFTTSFISSFFSSKTKVVGSNAYLLASIVASKPLSPLSFDSFSLSSILIPRSQTTFQHLGLVKLDANYVLSCSSDIDLPLNFPILGLNQDLCNYIDLSILH